MKTICHINELRQQCEAWRKKGMTIGLVPTMGYFHAGHLALMDHAKSLCDKLVVSLFVNPTQFGPNEDLSTYPRNMEQDALHAQEHGVDLLFTPDPKAMYSEDHATWIEVPELGQTLCGASRPGHFRGVCTVVAKLFFLTMPNIAVFGQKDWQQLAILKRMGKDLNIPVTIKGHPIVREEDGLALSSRNAYLSREERAQAPHIRKILLQAREYAMEETLSARALKEYVKEQLALQLPLGTIDYVDVVDPHTLQPAATVKGTTLVALAVQMGKARLIDNILIKDTCHG